MLGNIVSFTSVATSDGTWVLASDATGSFSLFSFNSQMSLLGLNTSGMFPSLNGSNVVASQLFAVEGLCESIN